MKKTAWYLWTIFPLFAQAQGPAEKFPLIQKIYEKARAMQFPHANVSCDTFYYTDQFVFDEGINNASAFIKNNSVIKKQLEVTGPDSLVLTPAELQVINIAFSTLKKHSWNNGLFPASVMISSKKIKGLLSAIDQSPDTLERKLCKTIYSFLPPVFFRGDSWCIFFQSANDILSQSGDCSVYYKEQGTWKRYYYISRWMAMDNP